VTTEAYATAFEGLIKASARATGGKMPQTFAEMARAIDDGFNAVLGNRLLRRHMDDASRTVLRAMQAYWQTDAGPGVARLIALTKFIPLEPAQGDDDMLPAHGVGALPFSWDDVKQLADKVPAFKDLLDQAIALWKSRPALMASAKSLSAGTCADLESCLHCSIACQTEALAATLKAHALSHQHPTPAP
jgi:hypothetical protein